MVQKYPIEKQYRGLSVFHLNSFLSRLLSSTDHAKVDGKLGSRVRSSYFLIKIKKEVVFSNSSTLRVCVAREK